MEDPHNWGTVRPMLDLKPTLEYARPPQDVKSPRRIQKEPVSFFEVLGLVCFLILAISLTIAILIAVFGVYTGS